MGSVIELKYLIEKILTDRTILKKLSGNIQPPLSFNEVGKETLSLYESVLANQRLVYN